MFEHKTVGATVSIPLRTMANKKNRKIIDLVNAKTICAEHLLNYHFQPDQYRLYRKGGNRCVGCGVKL